MAAKESLVNCLRAHGVSVPPENPSRSFSKQGVDTSSAAYKSAFPECLSSAVGVYRSMLRR